MKIKVLGKGNFCGVSKKTGKEYNFNQIHFLGKARGIEGQAAKTLTLSPADYPLDSIVIGKDYDVEFDENGYIVEFRPIN